MADKRYRNFALMTYLEPTQFLKVLNRHERQIKAYAYITHNKDKTEDGKPKTVHTHILVSIVNALTEQAVRNWFKGFEDESGQQINTLCQPMHDITSSFDYLTHSTENAIAEGKFQYDVSLVKGYNLEYFKNTALQEEDNITLAVTDIVNGVPLYIVAKRYGRDFIIHYQSIKMLVNDILEQGGAIEC